MTVHMDFDKFFFPPVICCHVFYSARCFEWLSSGWSLCLRCTMTLGGKQTNWQSLVLCLFSQPSHWLTWHGLTMPLKLQRYINCSVVIQCWKMWLKGCTICVTWGNFVHVPLLSHSVHKSLQAIHHWLMVCKSVIWFESRLMYKLLKWDNYLILNIELVSVQYGNISLFNRWLFHINVDG